MCCMQKRASGNLLWFSPSLQALRTDEINTDGDKCRWGQIWCILHLWPANASEILPTAPELETWQQKSLGSIQSFQRSKEIMHGMQIKGKLQENYKQVLLISNRNEKDSYQVEDLLHDETNVLTFRYSQSGK